MKKDKDKSLEKKWDKVRTSKVVREAQDKVNARKKANELLEKVDNYPVPVRVDKETSKRKSKKTEQTKELYNPKAIEVTKDTEIYEERWFVEGLIVDKHYNQVGGPLKLGKSLGLMEIMIARLRELNKGKKKTDKDFQRGLVISTENNANMLKKQILIKNACDFMTYADQKSIKVFDKKMSVEEKIDEVHKRIRRYLEQGFKKILIDPSPRFFNWNNESLVIQYIDGLEELADEFGACIIGVRNDGKTQYEEAHSMKGTSATEDVVRLLLRALKVWKNSVIWKLILEKKKDFNGKAFVLTSHYAQSLMADPKAFAFIIESTKLSHKGIVYNVPIAIKVLEIKYDLSRLKFMCSLASAKTDRQLIFHYIYKNPGCSKEQIKNYYPHIKYDSLKTSLKRLQKDSEKKPASIVEIEKCYYANNK